MPKIYNNFAPRINFITAVEWEAEDDGWVLKCRYLDENDTTKEIQFSTLPLQNSHAYICLPTTNDVYDISDDLDVVADVIRAHIRCATQIGAQTPGSTEWVDSLKAEGETSHMQTAVGQVKYIDHTRADDGSGGVCFHIDVRRGNGTIRQVVADYADLEKYTFVPSTQLLVLPGSIEKQFSSYTHDPDNNDFLSQSQRDAISAYLLAKTVWM